MKENLNTCCSCKRKSIIRCIRCEKEVKSYCGCIMDLPCKHLELDTSFDYPNIILYMCEECEKDLICDVGLCEYDYYLK